MQHIFTCSRSPMASGYALPTAGAHHAHSKSHSNLLPPSAQNGFAKSNGHIRKAPSTGGLYTHAEASRETTPSPNAAAEHQHYPFPNLHEHNKAAVEHNGHIHHQHDHGRSHSFAPVRSARSRGESDLGKPAQPRATAFRPTLHSIPPASTSWFSLPEALTALLIPAPFLFASAAYSSTFGDSLDTFPPLAAYDRPSPTDTLGGSSDSTLAPSSFLQACGLTGMTLLLVGALAKLRTQDRMSHGRKDSIGISLSRLKEVSAWQSMTLRALSIGLPFYASMMLGGMRTGLILLIAVAADLTCTDWKTGFSTQALKQVWSTKVATSVVILLSFISDELGLTLRSSMSDLMFGYLALTVSVLLLQQPLSMTSNPNATTPMMKTASSSARTISGSFVTLVGSPLTRTASDIDLTLFSGALILTASVCSSTVLGSGPALSIGYVALGCLTVGTMTASIIFSQPAELRGESKAGLALGCFVTASCSFLFSPTLWPGTMCNGGISALSFLGVLYDTNSSHHGHHHHHHDDHDEHSHDHSEHTHHHHHHQHSPTKSSAFTQFIMSKCEPGSLVYSILSEKDSRRIAYFTT